MIELPSPAEPRCRLGLIFTGHMVDLPDRAEPRFPPELENAAASIIRQNVAGRVKLNDGSLIGIASGACGGDILFHESCAALGLLSILVLPFEVERFRETSVRGVAKGNWEERFSALWDRLAPDRRIVLDGAETSDPYGACNRHMLALAECLSNDVELMALWDGADAGKPGGTGAFVEEVRTHGGRLTHLDINQFRAGLETPGA